jgi:hypothetical protein
MRGRCTVSTSSEGRETRVAYDRWRQLGYTPFLGAKKRLPYAELEIAWDFLIVFEEGVARLSQRVRICRGRLTLWSDSSSCLCKLPCICCCSLLAARGRNKKIQQMSVDVSRTPQSPSTIRLTSTDMLHVVALFRLFAFAICHPGVGCFSSLPFPPRLFVSHMTLVGTAHNRLSMIRLPVPLEATTSLPVLLDAWLLKAVVARDKASTVRFISTPSQCSCPTSWVRYLPSRGV